MGQSLYSERKILSREKEKYHGRIVAQISGNHYASFDSASWTDGLDNEGIHLSHTLPTHWNSWDQSGLSPYGWILSATTNPLLDANTGRGPARVMYWQVLFLLQRL